MSSEPKKLALLRIWQILLKHSDYNHPMTQEEIIQHLENDYGIEMPESIARVTAEQMINELSNENGAVTPQRLQVLFDSYALGEISN